MFKKLLIVGDMHLRDRRGYADYIEDGRLAEKDGVLNYIVDLSSDCDGVVFLGDNLNSKNNTSGVIKEFVNLLERLSPKTVFVLAGNHEAHADGRTAIDFLKEVKGKHWRVITNTVETIDGLTFCPYFYKNELGCETNEEAAIKLLPLLMAGGEYLFAHHAFTGSSVHSTMADTFNEIVLPADKLAEYYKGIFFGHIHESQTLLDGKIIGTGSVFCDEMGETSKSVWKLDLEANKVSQHTLPSRGIYGLTDPSLKSLDLIGKNNIVKVVLTEHIDAPSMEKIKEKLREFDAYVLLEQYPSERRKLVHNEKTNVLDLPVEELLKIYAEQNKINFQTLSTGWNILKQTI